MAQDPAASSSTLERLLDEDREMDPVTNAGLTNHRPMALVALAAMGAGAERLTSFANQYGDRLVPCRDQIIASRRELEVRLGRDGCVRVLHHLMPHLAEGAGGAAFHGLIRLGYAIEVGRIADIAAALAYFSDVTQIIDIPEPVRSSESSDLGEVLRRLHRDPALQARNFTATGFSARFAEISADPRFRSHVRTLSADACDLGSLASITLALYRSTRDFFALHTVTATHAARLVADCVAGADADTGADAARRLAFGLARAVAAAYVVIGAPEIASDDGCAPAGAEGGTGVTATWDDVLSAAVKSDDPHVLKMVHTCRAEHGAWGLAKYLPTAAEVAGAARS